MRNLKRALSLGLTAAMISGLMVMGSSAASYADVTSENNVEAIEVLEAVGIMIGDENGNFNPDQNVTRNEMAVVMANLMEYNVASYKDTSPFTDVPSWAEPYVAACWTNGITAGYSDTIYGGSDTVTTAQAALMLMKALGYFQYASDFGSDWQLATTRQGNAIDLFNGVDSGVTQAMTRNDVAQLVLNTLRAGTVQASTDGSWTIGDVTINNNVQYSYVTSNQTYATAIDDARSTSNTTDANRSIVELGEQLYMGDLKLNDNAIDDFGRPSRTWSYDGKEVGTYAKTELLVESYTTGVTGREMYDLLSAATINENDLARYVDGLGVDMAKTELGRNNKDDLAYTGNGALTEVYLDDDNDQITIATINTYLAQAVGDYSEGKEYAPLEIYMSLQNDRVVPHVYNVDVDDVEAVADVVDEQFYLVNLSFADARGLEDYENAAVTEIASPEVMENSTVTKWSDSTSKVVDKLTVDGTEYKSAVKAFYDEDTLEAYDHDLLTDMTYTLYLDQYGYVIGVDVYEGDLKYVFITGYDRHSSNLSVSTATAAGIFLDGTMEELKVNVKATNENIEDYVNDADNGDSRAYYMENGEADIWDTGIAGDDGKPTLNRWYRYSVNESGVYTLKPVDMTATLYADPTDANDDGVNDSYEDVTINTANVSVKNTVTAANTRVYGEDESVYVTVDTDVVDTTGVHEIAITDVDGVYTGVQNVNLEIDTSVDTIENPGVEAQVYTVYDKDNYIIGAVVIGDVSGSGDYAYILSDGATSEEKIGDTYYWTFDAILDGQIQTLTAKSKYTEIIEEIEDHQFDVLELRFDTDEYVVRVLEPDENDIYRYDEATDEIREPDITDYEVYYVENGVVDANGNYVAVADGVRDLELTLQGRTLYVTPDQSDFGLAMASDAVAVVIQPEYNKDNVKTEFTTVKSAISHLADANPATPELEYDGKIFAVLNTNGSAAWIVFDSINGLDTGTGGIIDDNNRNVIHNGNVALWGDNTVVVNGVSISYNYNQSSVAYSFVVPGANIGDVINYNVEARVNGQTVNVKNNVTGVVSQNERGNLVVVGTVNVPATAIDDVDVAVYNAVNQTANTASVVLNKTGAVVNGLATGTANVGDKITFTVEPADGYVDPVTVTGANVTANEDGSYTLTVVAGVNTVTVEATPIATYDIKFKTADYPSQFEFYVNNERVYDSDNGPFDSFIDNVKAGDQVMIVDRGTGAPPTYTFTTDGYVEVATGVYGIVDGTNNHTLSFTMPNHNITLADPATILAATQIVLTTGDGVTLTLADGTEIGPNSSKTVPQGTVITDADTTVGTGVINVASANDVARDALFTGATVNQSRWFFPAVDVTLTNVTTTTTGVNTTNHYVKVNTTLEGLAATTGTGVIDNTTGNGFGAAITSINVGTADVTLVNAVKVTMNDGITAKISAKDVTGEYVAVGQSLTITVPTTAGTAAIDLAGNTDNRHSSTATANGGSLSVSTSNIDLYAAVSISFNNTPNVWYYEDNNVDVHIGAGDYVLPGTELYTDDTNTVTYNGVAVDTTTVGDYIHFTVENHGVTITAP